MKRFTVLTLAIALTALAAGCPGSRPLPAGGSQRTREGYIEAGAGVRLFYRAVGVGRETVVVLHGGPGFTMDYLAPDLEPLAARRVLFFYDQRGTGRSTLVREPAALEAQRFADDLEAVRAHLGADRLTLVGHSWGAGVAALYAARYPNRIGRLLIVGPIPARRTSFTQAFDSLNARRDEATQRKLEALRAARLASPDDAAACRAYYRLWFAAYFADGAAVRRSRGDFCGGPPEALGNKIRSIDKFTVPSLGDWDWRAALRTITAPALVIHGAADFIPVESAREWAATMPNARLLLLEGSGHFPYLEAPEQFFAAADNFLRGGWPERAERGAASASR